MRNTYFILRHGQTIHQTEKSNIIYGWPDDRPACVLTETGREQVEKSAEMLKKEKIDLIFASDARRTEETARIANKGLKLKINFDERLRDVNWGVFQGKNKEEALGYFSSQEERFVKRPPEGESWNDCEKRISDFLEDIEKKYQGKNVLVVSHGDPLWLLEGLVKGSSRSDLLEQIKNNSTIKTGEFRKIN